MKTALVTGGSRGIGEAVCRRLANEGCFVLINYLNSKEKAEQLAKEIHGTAIQFDVSDMDSVSKAVSDAGKIDLLINNAGISEIDLFTHIPQEKANRIMSINLIGTMNCSRAVLPSMISRKSGCIINISSMWGQ